jgi:phenylacetate-CoA ligase
MGSSGYRGYKAMRMSGIQQTTDIPYKYWSVAELMPKDEMKKLQLQRVKEQINYVWEKSPFYRTKYEESGLSPDKIRTLEDIKQIPHLVKEEIRLSQEKSPPYGMMCVPGRGPLTRIAMTSGTTGEPVLIPFTEEDYFGVFCEGAVRALWGAGVRNADIVHAAFGFMPFVGLAGVYDASEHMIGAMVVPGGAWDTDIRIKMLQKFKVTVLMSTPTYLFRIAEVAEKSGIDMSKIGLRVVMTTGEPGGSSVSNTGKMLEKIFGAKVYDMSGTQETNYITWACEHGTAHINEDLVYLEVLDPDTDEPVAPGNPGKLVVTDLVQKTHPVIRFETGDIVEGIDHSFECPCGRTLSRFKGFRGRVGDIIKVRGVCVSVTGIENVIRGFDECGNFEYIAVREDNMDKIKVRVEPKGNAPQSEWDSLAEKIRGVLRASFLINMDVQLLPSGSLPVFELKAKRFKDLR